MHLWNLNFICPTLGVHFHPFFRLRCQMKNQWNNLFCIKSSRQASDCSDFPQSSFQTETNFIAGDHAFFVIANVFFVRRFYFAQMFGKNSPFFVAVWILVAKWLNVINIILNKVNPLFCLPHTKSSQAVWHFLKPCTELFLFQLKKKSQERIVFLQLLLV